ncbi:hypothetical protein BGZ68_004316, partial [Mortierella alpina]
MEALQEGNGLGRPATTLEGSRASLLLPSMESDPDSAAEDPAGEGGGDDHHPILAVSTLVSDDPGHVNQSPNTDSEGGGAASTGKRTGHFAEKSDV